MAQFKIFKETAVPSTLEPNAIYLVGPAGQPDFLEIYVTDSGGSATRRTRTEADIQTQINNSIAAIDTLEVVDDIAARDALNPSVNTQVLVKDATGDNTVASGAATYVYESASDTWTKISEAESLDVALNWSDLIGGPSSSPAAIDAAVADAHTHANMTELNKIGEDGDGCFTYAGDTFVATGNINW